MYNKISLDAFLYNDEYWDMQLHYSSDEHNNGSFNSDNYENTTICSFVKGKPLIMLNTIKISDLANCTFLDLQ